MCLTSIRFEIEQSDKSRCRKAGNEGAHLGRLHLQLCQDLFIIIANQFSLVSVRKPQK